MLVKGLKSNKVFNIFKLISRAVPLELFNEFMSLSLAQKKTIWITNLGSLDRFNTYLTII
ncbi:MAG: hypothetical protein ACFFEO_14590 [Candidatus Thorarchaeota archaeon]